MSKHRITRGLVAMALASIAALGTPGVSQGAATGSTVKATGNESWSPESIAVSRGTKVTWSNPSGDDHNVQSYKGAWNKNSGLGEGARTSFTFKKSGSFKYRCTLHSKLESGRCNGMCGQVKVQ